jgi:hypothetical protein
MRLIELAVVLALTIVPPVAAARQAGRVFHIGILSNVPMSSAAGAPGWGAFIQGLRDIGYIEDQNITIVHRSSEAQPG